MKRFTKILLAAGALTVSALSHAVPVVNWDVTVTGTWTAFAPNPGVSNVVPNTLSWGTSTGAGQSSLVITNPGVKNIPTWYGVGLPPAGYIAASVALTHNNKPITGTSLTGATLSVAVTVKPTAPIGPNQVLQTIAYDIKFVETPNSGTCAAASPPNNPCNDIFVLVDGLLNEVLDYDGQLYYVNAFPTSGGVLNTLSNTACAAAGQGNGCIGFTTEEGKSTELAFGLSISSEKLVQQVPEPGSLALIGLALAGVGFASRRRRSAA